MKDSQNDIKTLFRVNDRCYAPDTRGHIYQATIKRIVSNPEVSQKITSKYLVHFMGWNSRYDLWLTEDKLLPDTEESRLAAQQVQIQLKELKNRKNKKTSPAKKPKEEKASTPDKRNGEALRDTMELSPSYREQVSKECQTLLDSCKLPVSLQNILVQEHLYFNPLLYTNTKGQQNNNKKKVDSNTGEQDLPADIHVQRILHKFAKVSIREKRRLYCAKLDKNVVRDEIVRMKQMYNNFANDMCLLFDAALPKCLLYNFEREQYHRLLLRRPCETLPEKEPLENKPNHNDTFSGCGNGTGSNRNVNVPMMSQVYSGEYLLRMITRLPFLLSSIKRDAADKKYSSMSIMLKWKVAYHGQINQLAKLMSELVCFLDKYKSQIFKGKYLEEYKQT
jgi:hypothetical protein